MEGPPASPLTMRATITELFHVVLSFPFWVFAALVYCTVRAWRAPMGTGWRRWRFAWLVATLLFYGVSVPAAHTSLEYWLETRHAVPAITPADRRPDNVILVLTAGWLRATPTGYEQKIGQAGWERTYAAVELWRRIGGRLLFTGAPAPDGRDSAAAAMARIAIALGVPADAVIVEGAALNTHENFVFSRRLMGPAPGRVWLVTSALHMPRSVMAAHGAGFEVTPYPVDFRSEGRFSWPMLLPANSSRPALEAALHEVFGMLAYRVKRWG